MAIPSPAYWYVNYGDGATTGYYAVAMWTTLTVYAAGAIIRQRTAPAVGSERVFVCIVAGTSLVGEPTFVLTKGAKTAEAAGPTWQECTGQAALNGSLTYTSGWTSGPGGVGTGVKNQAVALGYIIANDAGANYQICTTAGTAGNGAQPSFSSTAGTTTADNTVTWTSLGVVGNFTTAYGAPFARLQSAWASTWSAAADVNFIADNHAETQGAAMSATNSGTFTLPLQVYCVDRTKVTPGTADLKTTATITTTGNFSMTIGAGSACFDGVIFSAGTGAVGAVLAITGTYYKFTNCSLRKLGTTGTTQAIQTSSQFEMVNTTVQFGSASDSLSISGYKNRWRNTPSAIAGATLPTTLLRSQNAMGILIDGVDLSGGGSGLVLFPAGNQDTVLVTFRNCALPASATIGAQTGQGSDVILIDCDSAATNYRQQRSTILGTLSQETTIVRTSGASDGTTPLAWKIVTTATPIWNNPFECFLIYVWNSRTGSSLTATVEIQSSATLNNDDIWLEIEYFGSSSTPQASFANSTKANNLATGTALTVSTKTWSGAPSTPIKQVLSVAFTPLMAGPVIGRIYVAKAALTVYVDPQLNLPGVTRRSYIVAPGVYINEPARPAAGFQPIEEGIAA